MTRGVLTDHVIIDWVAASGERIRLSGAKSATELGAWLAAGNIGDLGYTDLKALFDAAARQWGETWTGSTLDHAEWDLPLFILGTSPDDFRRRVEHVKRLCRNDVAGWLMVYTNALGWRWVRARRGSLKPTLEFDPRKTSAANFDLTLLVDVPVPRVADDNDSWSNKNGTGRGTLALYPGDTWDGWPQFTFRGPGALTLSFAGNQVTHPPVLANETMLVNTDEARPTVRAVTDAGVRRNLWPLMKGKKYRNPIPAGEVTRVDISVTGGNTNTALYAVVPQAVEGLL